MTPSAAPARRPSAAPAMTPAAAPPSPPAIVVVRHRLLETEILRQCGQKRRRHRNRRLESAGPVAVGQSRCQSPSRCQSQGRSIRPTAKWRSASEVPLGRIAAVVEEASTSESDIMDVRERHRRHRRRPSTSKRVHLTTSSTPESCEEQAEQPHATSAAPAPQAEAASASSTASASCPLDLGATLTEAGFVAAPSALTEWRA